MTALGASLSNSNAPPAPLDCCWSVPVLSAFTNLLSMMPVAGSGVFYVLVRKKFGVSREIASWPIIIENSMIYCTGLTVFTIQKNLSLHTILILCSVLCSAALIASAFATSVTWMTITLGCLYGFPAGILLMSTALYVVSYFKKYRGLATGLVYVGVSISGVTCPILLSAFVDIYGFAGSLLLLGGITLNIIPIVLLMKNPQPTKRSLCCSTQTSKSSNNSEPAELQATCSALAPTKSATPQTREDLHDTQEAEVCRSVSQTSNAPATKFQPRSYSAGGIWTEISRVLCRPALYIILVPAVTTNFAAALLLTTIVDYATDKGMQFDKAALLLTYAWVGELCGHVVIPSLSDKVTGSRCTILAISVLLLSASFMILPHVAVYPAAGAAVVFVMGMQIGYSVTMRTVLAADYLGVQRVTLCLGLIGIAMLPFTFVEPSIVGVFRDNGGSYDNLYRLCGGINLFSALLLLINECVRVKKSRLIQNVA